MAVEGAVVVAAVVTAGAVAGVDGARVVTTVAGTGAVVEIVTIGNAVATVETGLGAVVLTEITPVVSVGVTAGLVDTVVPPVVPGVTSVVTGSRTGASVVTAADAPITGWAGPVPSNGVGLASEFDVTEGSPSIPGTVEPPARTVSASELPDSDTSDSFWLEGEEAVSEPLASLDGRLVDLISPEERDESGLSPPLTANMTAPAVTATTRLITARTGAGDRFPARGSSACWCGLAMLLFSPAAALATLTILVFPATSDSRT